MESVKIDVSAINPRLGAEIVGAMVKEARWRDEPQAAIYRAKAADLAAEMQAAHGELFDSEFSRVKAVYGIESE